ncbi:sn-glycerol-1-phosphate dehydrogenase [Pseudactinotalea sp. Z1748]|uniref:sn-glycerol-1-phosphate dehydrogenase n=1 Tax=Pseudactinotalea sp. Z1748 TaxID=3413027 RepID=UPI003C7BCFAA
MTNQRIDAALAAATDTRRIALGNDALAQVSIVFTDLFGHAARAIVIADDNTYAVAGRRVEESLRAAGVEVEPAFIFPGTPTLYGDYTNVQALRDHLANVAAHAVCVGSGTLNDITKLASGESDREYLVVATAPSQDGYAAFGASITRDGFKITRNCPAPAGIVGDLGILAAAPSWLTATGYGDLVEKLTAGADWLIADALGIEPVDDHIWRLVQDPLRDALADPVSLVRGEAAAVRKLTEGLVMSGLAMQAHQSSRPASGSGHHFSHLWEMEGLGMTVDPPLSHGLKVGLGTVAVAALYEVVLELDLTGIDVDAAVAAWPSREEAERTVRAALDGPMVEPSVARSLEKYVDAEHLRARLETIRHLWPGLRRRLRDQLVPAGKVQEWLDAVGAVSHPAQIGLDMQKFRESYVRSNMIRNRFTVVDLMAQVGHLEDCVARLFAPNGFWGAQAW